MKRSRSDDPRDGRHPADVFEANIEDLERPTVRSWSSVLAAIGAFALLAAIVLMVMAYQMRTYRAPTGIGNVAAVELLEPSGTLDHLPSAFRWGPASGAGSYLVTVQREGNDEVVLLRSSTAANLFPTAQDLAQFRPGTYRWSVEARGADGKTRAWGEGEFTLAAPAE